MARMRFKYNRNWSISRVVTKVLSTTLALYVGNLIMVEIGSLINGSSGPFVNGFKLIGYTVTNGTITNTSGSSVLAVVGVVGFASIITEFVNVKMM